MTNRSRAIISFLVIIAEIIGLALILFGIYKGVPTNVVYIPLGGVLVIGGNVIILLVNKRVVK